MRLILFDRMRRFNDISKRGDENLRLNYETQETYWGNLERSTTFPNSCFCMQKCVQTLKWGQFGRGMRESENQGRSEQNQTVHQPQNGLICRVWWLLNLAELVNKL